MLTRIRAGEVPEVIRKTAEEIAGIFYNEPRTPKFRKIGMTEKAFIRRYWTDHVDQAIQSLAGCLALPGLDAKAKAQIADAIFEYQSTAAEHTPSISTRRIQ